MTPPSTRAQELEISSMGHMVDMQSSGQGISANRRNAPPQLASPVQQLKLQNKLPVNRRLELDQCLKNENEMRSDAYLKSREGTAQSAIKHGYI